MPVARVSRPALSWRCWPYSTVFPEFLFTSVAACAQMKFSIDDNNKYSTRRNLGPIDCFYKCCGMSTCRLCLPCTFCLKFGCDDTPCEPIPSLDLLLSQ
jgi:hypothetical protein